MIKITLLEVSGWYAALTGMRNPMNSWDKRDSWFERYKPPTSQLSYNELWQMGDSDHDLAMRLASAGSDHAKFRRMIHVQMDVVAPLYWWKEFDTYKVGTVANSCSTMHKICAKPIELSDFSMDDLELEDEGISLKDMFASVVQNCERLRQMYLAYSGKAKRKDCFSEAEILHFQRVAKFAWRGLIQLLPASYSQKRTVDLSYEVLANIYAARKAHKLDEWREFCQWIKTLPYSELITGKE